ncbi:MAG: elongation factor G [Chloroflexota bacterium]|nr:elongation factor G [Chloroflexota bacterium]
MKEYPTESIRNIVLASHGGAGKTMLVEAFANFTGITTRMGQVEDGTTLGDYDEEEIRRGISLFTSVVPIEYQNTKLNFFDTPGYTDFIGEVISAMRVADGVLILVDSVAGLEVGTEMAFQYSDQFKLPKMILINKMERDNANFQKALQSVQDYIETRLIPLQIPWGERSDFKGVIDLLSMKAFEGDSKQGVEIPAEFQEQAAEAHLALVEAAAEGEDELLEKYFENSDLTDKEIMRGLRSTIWAGNFIPVMVAAGAHMIGLVPLLEILTNLMPSPMDVGLASAVDKNGEEITLEPKDDGPLAAYVWKTTADPFVGKQTFFRVYSGMMKADERVWNSNKEEEERQAGMQVPQGKEGIPARVLHCGDIGLVAKLSVTTTGDTLCEKGNPIHLPQAEYPKALYQVALFPKTQSDAAKLSSTLSRLCEEDLTLSWHNEPTTRQTILQGMGDQHIDVAIRRAVNKFQLGLNIEEPKVPYEERITRENAAMYRHKKQTGGAGQFGEVHLRVAPIHEGNFEFVNDVVGGSISNNYMPSIEKGIKNVMKGGVIAGYPVHNVKVSVFDGKEHPVDSKPIAFEVAGREAFRMAFKGAGPVLYEPIMKAKVIVPESNMGDVLGDMNSRRARVQGMDTQKGRSIVTANVPLAEMLRYTTILRSMTGGRGYFTMEFDHYEMVPQHLAQEIIEAKKREDEENED